MKRLRFVDAVMLSAIPLLVTGYLVGSAAMTYQRTIQFDDWWSARASVARFFRDRVRSFLKAPQAASLEQELAMDAPDAGIIRLNLPQDDWSRFWADPQLEWGVWKDAVLTRENSLLPVKVRKRGDNSIHWVTEKRTFTVRSPREEFFKRFRLFGLTVKDVVPVYLANRLAGEFGLLAPETEVVPVFINNRFSGIYRFVETVDESFLRPYDRMPGNIYRGDAAERSDFFKGVPRDLFANPYIWNRVAVNDRPTGPGMSQFHRFLADINGSRFEDHLRLMSRLNRDELARLFAYLLLVGDPYHMDAVHNQLWYEDPSTSLLHPIPWDIRLLRLDLQNVRMSPVFRAVLRDPFLADGILREVKGHLDRGVLRTADSLLGAVEGRYPAALAYDRLRSGLIPDIGDSAGALAILRANAQELLRWMDDATVAAASGSDGGLTVLDLETRGYAGADLTALDLSSRTTSAAVHLDRNQNGVLDPSDPPVTGRWQGSSLVLDQPIALLPGWRTDTLGVFAGRVAYRFFLRGAVRVEPRLRNRVTGVEARAVEWGNAGVIRTRSFSPWQFPLHRPTTHRWSGTLRLTETVRIPAGDTLRVAAGTTLRLAPDVSIVSRGVMLFEGTRERPIEVIPDVMGKPWGAVSTLGAGSDGTRVTWTRFFYGGGAMVDGIEYIGMINLHRTRRALFRHVTFERNVRSDDTFHALHSEVVLDSSRFIDANSDAVDMDISTGRIASNDFANTGGDAVDLMTSTPLVYGNRSLGSGDKGISVGENSSPLIFNNYIEGARRGIETKDRSDPVILNNYLVRNGVGVYQDRKNWRYGGGAWATIANTIFEDNKLDLQSDQYSRITLAANPGLDSAVGAGAPWLQRWAGGGAVHPGLDWLYASYGLPASADTAALMGDLVPSFPKAPREGQRFQEDFLAYRDGWLPIGSGTRVFKYRDCLVLTAERRDGSMELPINWTVNPGERRILVIEAAAAELLGAVVEVQSEAGLSTHPLELTEDLNLFRLNLTHLGPGHYTRLRIRAAPRPFNTKLARGTGWLDEKPGTVALRSWRLVEAPDDASLPKVAVGGSAGDAHP